MLKEIIEKLIKDTVSSNSDIKADPVKTHYETDHENIPDNYHGDRTDDYLKGIAYKNLTNRLHEKHFDYGNTDPVLVNRIKFYTKEINGVPNSRELNKKLHLGESLSDTHLMTHNAIMKLVKPMDMELHVYSGVQKDLGELARQSKDHILDHPGHMSVSHNPAVARDFAVRANTGNSMNWTDHAHIAHIHMKPENKGLHVGYISRYPDEYETIIPAGTKLKYSHSTEHKSGLYKNIHVHHFTIHSQP